MGGGGGYSKFSMFEKAQLSLSAADTASCLVEPQFNHICTIGLSGYLEKYMTCHRLASTHLPAIVYHVCLLICVVVEAMYYS